MIKRTLSPDAMAVEDCETEVKQIVRKGYFSGLSRAQVDTKAAAVIKAMSKKVKSEALRQVAVAAMYALVARCWALLVLAFGSAGKVAFMAIKAAQTGKLTADIAPSGSVSSAAAVRSGGLDYETSAKGVPAQKYSKDYMRDVQRTMVRFADEEAVDLNDVGERHSIRARAELEVRFSEHEENIENLRKAGERLVVCSVHADCSKRCSPYQGRVYSLDGTRGTTADGRAYVPLEEATNNPRDKYVTKAGKVYQNGLLGYNCRHYLYAYREGMAIPKVSKAEQEKERAVNARQREYERTIRLYRERALTLAETNPVAAREYKEKAAAENKAYIDFSRENKRAYYPDRVKILF